MIPLPPFLAGAGFKMIAGGAVFLFVTMGGAYIKGIIEDRAILKGNVATLEAARAADAETYAQALAQKDRDLAAVSSVLIQDAARKDALTDNLESLYDDEDGLMAPVLRSAFDILRRQRGADPRANEQTGAGDDSAGSDGADAAP